MIKSDILIIGAGPVGLFAVFEAGLLKMKCHLIDILPNPGGQCSEIYPKKPIYDIPAYPEILADGLIDKLMEQCSQFQPGFTLGERAMEIDKQQDNSFIVTTDKGTKHSALIVVIAGGLGSFEPRKPIINNIEKYEGFSIGIIAPYAQQVRYIKSQVSEDESIRVHDVTINSIDGFQGQEKDVIYISLVRSNESGELGFLKDLRRLNVAITRAKKKLIIIGDVATLSSDQTFLELLEHVEKHGLYQSAWEYMAI